MATQKAMNLNKPVQSREREMYAYVRMMPNPRHRYKRLESATLSLNLSKGIDLRAEVKQELGLTSDINKVIIS